MGLEVIELQLAVCEKLGVPHVPSPGHKKAGVSEGIRIPLYPLNGLRHTPRGETTGWYIWGGEELSTAPDFFAPLHVEHLQQWCPQVLPYLGLPPGWRFLVAPDYEDIWFDSDLLGV